MKIPKKFKKHRKEKNGEKRCLKGMRRKCFEKEELKEELKEQKDEIKDEINDEIKEDINNDSKIEKKFKKEKNEKRGFKDMKRKICDLSDPEEKKKLKMERLKNKLGKMISKHSKEMLIKIIQDL